MGIAVSPQIHPHVAEFIDKPRKMLINGQWVNAASGKTFPSYDPSSGEVLATIAEGDRADIDLRRLARQSYAAFIAADRLEIPFRLSAWTIFMTCPREMSKRATISLIVASASPLLPANITTRSA